MSTKIKHIHHVGHVVTDMEVALELYRKLGFVCPNPSYPTMAEKEGEAPKPLGAANTHATFLHNFIEIVTVVDDEKRIPRNANLVPLQAPPTVLPRILDNIRRTVSKISNCLSRFEGTHILCFCTSDAEASAAQLDQEGVKHSGVNPTQRPIETINGKKMVPLNVIEIDGEDVPEGRLAIADNPSFDILKLQSHMDHPNGAYELVEVILCVADSELDDFTKRYQRYLGHDVQMKGVKHIFDLNGAHITIVPKSRLNDILPGKVSPPLPGFVGYTVAVRDISATRKYIEENGFPVVDTKEGDIFVPASMSLGTAIIFRQIRE
ncbi:VOC family protein [Desmospora activa]|uniref:Glyoxalase-like protein n=1 Tax=Desmospora activa DSM 45169 TaxID=1121389 RepID=A0A2T4ZA11_9BACL|nr:VOC family protein [Desmospora activa]PTM58727.1 glyoxalase-like protein [Desmospora activa DSM 45169]